MSVKICIFLKSAQQKRRSIASTRPTKFFVWLVVSQMSANGGVPGWALHSRLEFDTGCEVTKELHFRHPVSKKRAESPRLVFGYYIFELTMAPGGVGANSNVC